MANGLTVNVRMYHVGELGDCFLLHFKEGEKESRVLIDCGSFRNGKESKKQLNKIVTHILSEPGTHKLDVVVGTHQHNDHVSGFVHCESQFINKVKEVWLSWLDDPKDPFARQIKQSQEGLVRQLRAISAGMKGLNSPKAAGAIRDILGFYGIDEETPSSADDAGKKGVKGSKDGKKKDPPLVPAEGIRILKNLGDKDPLYLSPGKIMNLPGLPANSVKVYVLGPPRKQSLLFDKDPNKTETYDPHLAMVDTFAGKFLSAVHMQETTGQALSDEEKKARDMYKRAEEYFPFNRSYKQTDQKIKEIREKADAEPDPDKKAKIMAPVNDLLKIRDVYDQPDNDYRRIDNDWIDQGGRLALYLNSYTNNSSLVLAFELVKSKKVLLFAADAQTGNWNSWDKIKWDKPRKGFSCRELLANTVLYKVGHHASHNATLVSAFKAMEHEELVAMIPVDRNDPNILKENGWKMPAKNLYAQLKAKTKFRVLRMDDGYAEGCDPIKNKAKSKWHELDFQPVRDKSKLFIDYKIQG